MYNKIYRLTNICKKLFANKKGGSYLNKKLFIGNLAIIIGGLVLSLELIGLQIIKMIEGDQFHWYSYITMFTPVFIAFIITISIIGYGINIVVKSIKEQDKNN